MAPGTAPGTGTGSARRLARSWCRACVVVVVVVVVVEGNGGVCVFVVGVNHVGPVGCWWDVGGWYRCQANVYAVT